MHVQERQFAIPQANIAICPPNAPLRPKRCLGLETELGLKTLAGLKAPRVVGVGGGTFMATSDHSVRAKGPRP